MLIHKMKIGDLCLVGDGTHSSIQRTDTGVMYLSSKNFSKEGIVLEKVDYISKEDYEKYFKESSSALTKPQENDLIFSIIGSIGGVYLYKKNDSFGLSSSVAMIRVNSDDLDVNYLYYYLKSEFLQKWAEIIKSGSAQGFLSLAMIRSLPLHVPPLKTQQKIASLLSNYDRLIENNTQRIKVLESMGEELYKEWFVRLRFPGYDDVEVVDGVPEGWERKEITFLAYINHNTLTKSAALSEINYLDIASVNTGYYENSEKMLFSEAPSRARRILKYGDTIFSTVRPNRKTYCLILENNDSLIASTGFAVITPKEDKNIAYIYLAVTHQSFVDNVVAKATGATYPAINQKNFEKLNILIPTDNILTQFSDTLIYMQEKKVLLEKNQTLKQTRDLLLPRLMSGKLNVEDLDII